MKVKRLTICLALAVSFNLVCVSLASAQLPGAGDQSTPSVPGLGIYSTNPLDPADSQTRIVRQNSTFQSPICEFIYASDPFTGAQLSVSYQKGIPPRTVKTDSAASLAAMLGVAQTAVYSFFYFPPRFGPITCDANTVLTLWFRGRVNEAYGFSPDSATILEGKATSVLEKFYPLGSFSPTGGLPAARYRLPQNQFPGLVGSNNLNLSKSNVNVY